MCICKHELLNFETRPVFLDTLQDMLCQTGKHNRVTQQHILPQDNEVDSRSANTVTLVPWVHFHVVDHIMLFQLDSHRLAYLLAESHQARDVLQDAEGGLTLMVSSIAWQAAHASTLDCKCLGLS